MYKRVIYTCIFGGYDEVKDPKVITSGWDYILFTDREVKTKVWNIRPLYGDPKMLSRDVKMNPHKYLPEYAEWFYFDGAIVPKAKISINSPFSWLGYEHRVRDPWQEASKIFALKKGNKFIINGQLDDYEKEGIKKDLGHMAGGVLYRKNTPGVRKMNEAWWNEFCKYPSRDQISLYKIIHSYHHLVQWNYLDHWLNKTAFEFNLHLRKLEKPKVKDPMIYEFTPSGTGPKLKDYGTALNKHCELVPNDDDWIIIRDQDTMYFPGPYRQIIKEAIEKHPDTGIFGAYTNRIGLSWQRLTPEPSEDSEIMNHYAIAAKRYSKYGSRCTEVNRPIAGFFMMFKKSTWKNIKFKEGDFSIHHDALFDWEFSQRVLGSGLSTRLIEGLYLFHFYRFHQADYRSVKHLMD